MCKRNGEQQIECGGLACKIRDDNILTISPGGYTCKEKVAQTMGPHKKHV
jgi:hypothetical protein